MILFKCQRWRNSLGDMISDSSESKNPRPRPPDGEGRGRSGDRERPTSAKDQKDYRPFPPPALERIYDVGPRLVPSREEGLVAITSNLQSRHVESTEVVTTLEDADSAKIFSHMRTDNGLA